MLKTWRPLSQMRHCHHLYSMLPFYDGDPDTPPYMCNSCDDGPGHPVILCVCVCTFLHGMMNLRWFSTEYAVRLSNYNLFVLFVLFHFRGWGGPTPLSIYFFEYTLITHLDTSTCFWVL